MGAPLPLGFEVEAQPVSPRRRGGMAFRGLSIPAGTVPHDGDTLPLGDGLNGRVYGIDAFELDQPGWQDGQAVPLGRQARGALESQLLNGATAAPTGASTFGRPVVTLNNRGGDPAEALVSRGMALPEPQYLAGNKDRLDDYIAAQDDAIAAERGAYAGQFQKPSDFRHVGQSAPIMGKIPLTPEQQANYRSIVAAPNGTPDTLADWYARQGHPALPLSVVPFTPPRIAAEGAPPRRPRVCRRRFRDLSLSARPNASPFSWSSMAGRIIPK